LKNRAPRMRWGLSDAEEEDRGNASPTRAEL
jgi:hypothetical protein